MTKLLSFPLCTIIICDTHRQAAQLSCKQAVVCDPTSYATAAATATTDTVCLPCTTAAACSAGQRLAGTCSGPSLPGSTTFCSPCNGLVDFQDLVIACASVAHPAARPGLVQVCHPVLAHAVRHCSRHAHLGYGVRVMHSRFGVCAWAVPQRLVLGAGLAPRGAALQSVRRRSPAVSRRGLCMMLRVLVLVKSMLDVCIFLGCCTFCDAVIFGALFYLPRTWS